MKITVLSVGKLKEKYWRDAVKEYEKRLSKYAKVRVLEVADEKTKENATDVEREIIKTKEGERILKSLPKGAFVVTLEIGGASLSSEAFSKKLEQVALKGYGHLVFVIGGSLGLSKAVMQKSDYALSFSKMTFPHQLMRVVLMEQIYRAYRISRHEPYHK